MQPRPEESPLKRTQVVGGVASFIRETATPKLARWGFAVEQKLHVDMDRAEKAQASVNPSKVDVLIVFEDMIHHRQTAQRWKDAAKASGVRCALLTRKEGHWADQLKTQGFEPINPNTAAAVAETGEEDVGAPTADKKPDLKSVPPVIRAPGGGLEDKLQEIKLALLEAKELGLHRLTFDGTTGKLTYSRPVLVEENEDL